MVSSISTSNALSKNLGLYSPDGPQNQIESNTAIEVTQVVESPSEPDAAH
jgi:hypothetical protein